LPKLLNRLRFENVSTSGQSSNRAETLIWRLWSLGHAHPRLYRLGTLAATKLRKLLPNKLGAWTRVRKAPTIARQSLHDLARREGFDHE
jgi:L-lactate dehydrogenase complex protein LldF